MAEIATGNREDAFDILQDAMCKLVEKYADHETSEWGPLFQTILQSKIRDWYRRNTVRNRFRSWLSFNDEQNNEDPIQTVVVGDVGGNSRRAPDNLCCRHRSGLRGDSHRANRDLRGLGRGRGPGDPRSPTPDTEPA